MKELRALIARNRAGSGEALASVCSAHPDVIAASALLAEEMDAPLLIEATSNQVNQFGGYTGMKPPDFIAFVRDCCRKVGVSDMRPLFGGDHLGPQVWRRQSAGIAMANARDLVAAYVKAGFTKVHLDCSEGCNGEPAQVSDSVSASRAADLAAECEAAAVDADTLSYVYGTEVPPPGGARVEPGGQGVEPTKPESALRTISAHQEEFAKRSLQSAWERSVGLVVQPGVEFAPDHVHHFNLMAPNKLSPVLKDLPGQAFEAHSTDYQLATVFPSLAKRNFAVLKVGPALTYAYRQAIYALEGVASWAEISSRRETVPSVMERLMLENRDHWTKHYAGTEAELRILRHFSYADRIRYYWAVPEAQTAVSALLTGLGPKVPSRMVLEQFFSPVVIARAERLEAKAGGWARALVWAQVQDMLAPYYFKPAR